MSNYDSLESPTDRTQAQYGTAAPDRIEGVFPAGARRATGRSTGRRKLTVSMVVAAMLALFAGFITVQNTASASILDGPIPANAIASAVNWQEGRWPFNGPSDTAKWPMTGGASYPTAQSCLAFNSYCSTSRVIDGGAQYQDRDGQLTAWFQANASCCLAGLTFWEYDVNDRGLVNGRAANRGSERIVRAVNPAYPGQEVTFYTPDHYSNFYKM